MEFGTFCLIQDRDPTVHPREPLELMPGPRRRRAPFFSDRA